jgi:hypothetical protein
MSRSHRQLEACNCFRSVEAEDRARVAACDDRRQQTVVGREERVASRDYDDDIARRADTGIDDGDVHGAAREV